MTKLFEDTRIYIPSDPELISLLGSKDKQAQMRHFGRSPAFYKLGRKIIYHGEDLNKWAEENKIDPNKKHD